MPPRTPAELSAQMLKEIAVLRRGDAPAAAADHERKLKEEGEWSFEAHDLLEPLDPTHPLTETPAELSAELAEWLSSRVGDAQDSQPPEGLDVTDTDWAEFERWGGEKQDPKAKG